MFSRLNVSFRTRIFIVLGAVVLISIASILTVVQRTTEDRVKRNIRARFSSTIRAFRQLQELRTQFASDEIETLTTSNTQFRTILSTASVGTEDFGFGQPAGRDEVLKDANLRLNSLLPFLPLYRKSDIFIVADAGGELVFSKSAPEKFGSDLSGSALFRRVLEKGEAVAVWNSGNPSLDDVGNVKPHFGGGRDSVYQVVAKPVTFDDQVYGVVLWGSRIDRKTLEGIKEISSVDIALFSGGKVDASTLSSREERELSNFIGSDTTGGKEGVRDPVAEVSLGGERFMSMKSPILPGAGMDGSGFIVLKSLTEELGFLRKLQITLLLIGGIILLVAIGLSFLVSGGVTKPVRTLAAAARRIGKGELETRVDIRTGDELEELGSAFNEMTKGLKEREFIKSTFERYVSETVASELIKNPDMARLGGMKKELTVMFSDIGGFTSR